ncbi:conjugal transfer protein [Streptococcus agalactiae]|nr:conjugal transfer protein [Streptococcus agalactiae]
MNKVNTYLNQSKAFLGKFQKKEKKKGNPKPKQVSKRTVNMAVLSGLCLIFGVAILSTFRSITLYSKVEGLQKLVTQVKNTKNKAPTQTRTVDKNLEVYLGNYVKAYFAWDADAEKQSQQLDYLNSFYNAVPDIKAQGQTKNPTQLKYYQLLKIEDHQATFGVGYEETIKKDGKDVTEYHYTGFNVPYGLDGDLYYISGLPWFSAIENHQAGKQPDSSKTDLSYTDNFSAKDSEKLTKFLNTFFTNYTTNQDNLNLMADNVSVVPNTTFKSLDFTYFKKDKDHKIKAYVQATFKVGETTHAENFTLTITTKSGSYYVSQLYHTIPADYADDQENERN